VAEQQYEKAVAPGHFLLLRPIIFVYSVRYRECLRLHIVFVVDFVDGVQKHFRITGPCQEEVR
jgi:hypothetical protein